MSVDGVRLCDVSNFERSFHEVL